MYQPFKFKVVATIWENRDSEQVSFVDELTPLKALSVRLTMGLKLCICKTTKPKLSVQLYVHEQH